MREELQEALLGLLRAEFPQLQMRLPKHAFFGVVLGSRQHGVRSAIILRDYCRVVLGYNNIHGWTLDLDYADPRFLERLVGAVREYLGKSRVG